MKKLSVYVALLMLLLVGAASASPGMTPSTLEATLAPGEMVSEDKTVDVPEVAPKADVVFAFDLTSSMGGIINKAKSQSLDIMGNLSLVSADINFGVMSYMDYPHNYSSYGYSALYGWAPAGDYAYSLDQSITGDQSSISSTIINLTIGSGADGPQDYTRIMYESYADTNVSWRTGSKKILLNFGDNVPHDDNLNESVPGKVGNWSTGGDPGRDEVMFTADDLDLQTVLSGMATNNVILLESHTTTHRKDYWDYWTNITGGSTFVTSSSTLVDDVIAEVTAGLTSPTVNNLHLEASTGYESWLNTVTPSNYTGPTNVTVNFSLTIKVPEGTADGVYTFNISAVDENDVSYGEQTVTITVVSTIEISLDVKPSSCPNPFNLNSNGMLPVAIAGTSDFDVMDIDTITILLGFYDKDTNMIVQPIALSRHTYEDVTEPYMPTEEEPCCIENQPDGYIDLSMKFDGQGLAGTLAAYAGEEVCLAITGETTDGRDIFGMDCIRVQASKSKNK